MKIHFCSDGSYGYQYEIGDRVIVKRTIHGGWFDIGPTRSECCTIREIWDGVHFPLRKSLVNTTWRTAQIEVHYSKEWGNALCFPWMLEPHQETLDKAERIKAVNHD